MGKISDYTRVLVSKLTDVFACDQTDNGTTETKSATVEQIGTAIGTLQNFADLDTSNKNLVDAINEIASYTPVYGNTASGAIATFDTSLALPLQDCTIEVGANKVVNVSGNVTDLATYIRGIYQGIYGFVDLGSLEWTYNLSLDYFSATLSDMKKATQADELLNWVQNKYTQIGARFNVDWGSAPDKSIGTRQTTSYVCVKDSAYTDATAFTNAMNGIYLVYELATPTTPTITQAQLTTVCASFGVLGTAYDLPLTDKPTTYVGTNNVFSDNGNTSVVYACSLKDYIEGQ